MSAFAAPRSKNPTDTSLETGCSEDRGMPMGMNNIFYRFHHLTKNEKYATMPARLRMNGIRAHKADPVDFELWCLAASAVNGCGKCIDAHENVLRQKGITEEIMIASVRIASVVHAIGTVLGRGAQFRGGASVAGITQPGRRPRQAQGEIVDLPPMQLKPLLRGARSRIVSICVVAVFLGIAGCRGFFVPDMSGI